MKEWKEHPNGLLFLHFAAENGKGLSTALGPMVINESLPMTVEMQPTRSSSRAGWTCQVRRENEPTMDNR